MFRGLCRAPPSAVRIGHNNRTSGWPAGGCLLERTTQRGRLGDSPQTVLRHVHATRKGWFSARGQEQVPVIEPERG